MRLSPGRRERAWKVLGIQCRWMETGNRDSFGKRPEGASSAFIKHLLCAGPWDHSLVLPGCGGAGATWSPCGVAMTPALSVLLCAAQPSGRTGCPAPHPYLGQQVRGQASQRLPVCPTTRYCSIFSPHPPMLSPSLGLVGRQHSREKRPLPVATAGPLDKGQLGAQTDLGRLGKGPGSATCLAPQGTFQRLGPEPPGFQHHPNQTGLTAPLFYGGQASAPLTCTALLPPHLGPVGFPGPTEPHQAKEGGRAIWVGEGRRPPHWSPFAPSSTTSVSPGVHIPLPPAQFTFLTCHTLRPGLGPEPWAAC